MQLSVCLITRNEEARLGRALQSVAGVADEIIITDTGSADDTLVIAERFGASISHFAWCDDFSAARNFCFSQAQGEWIFWIDADEELLPDSADPIRQCLRDNDAFAWWILRQDMIEIDRSDLYTEMHLPRLFRRDDRLNLQGYHHEQFIPSLSALARNRNQVVKRSTVRIRHDGFAGPKRKDKFERDIILLERELRERPGQLYYQIELYRTLLQMDDARWRTVFDEAMAHFIPYISDERPPIALSALLLETLLQLPEGQLPKELRHAKLRELAERWFPRSAPLLWLMAQEDYHAGRFLQAETLLRKLVQMGLDHSYDTSVYFDPRIVGDNARMNLGVCLTRQNKLYEAAQIFEALRVSPTHRAAAEENLRVIKQIRHSTPGAGRRNRRK